MATQFESYYLNHRTYSKEELLSFAHAKLNEKDLGDWEKDLYAFIFNWFSSENEITIKTSGSTGNPKEIRFTKAQMICSAQRTLEYFQVQAGENVLLCLPVKYIAGMMMVVRAFAGRLNLITLAPQKLQLEEISGNIDFASLVPLQIEKIIDKKQDLNKLKKILVGGTSIGPKLLEKLNGFYKGQAWETYGMTETLTHVAVRKITGSNPSLSYTGLPGITFSTDERGCLSISDPYLQAEPVQTNDCVDLISNTQFRLLGRFDNIINSGGIKIRPEELERELAFYIKNKFCISSIADEKLGEQVVLLVEKGTDLQTVEKGIKSLDTYKQPKKTIELEQFPVTRNGKTDHPALKRMLREIFGKEAI
jgi:o-succinylbenzoate---CoA ligase